MLHAPTSATENKTATGRTRTVPAPESIPYRQLPSTPRSMNLAAMQRAYGNQAVLRMLENAEPRSMNLAAMQRAYGNQAVLRMLANASPRDGGVQRKCACGASAAGGECASCAAERETALQGSATGRDSPVAVPPVVDEVLRSSGQPLDATTRALMEPRFGHDFSQVRVHTDDKAAESARAVSALAYTVGRQMAFDAGQYAPSTSAGRYLIAHELAHVVQNGGEETARPRSVSDPNDLSERAAEAAAQSMAGAAPSTWTLATKGVTFARPSSALRRTPASKVSCGANPPLTLPDGTTIDDPVSVITDAETEANRLLDNAIGELSFTIDQIRGGATIGFPTISDALGFGLQLMGLDPNSDRVWKQQGGVGNYTAALLLRRLRLIRGTIGKGSFFFLCLGPQVGTIGTCTGPICQGGDAASCGGSFQIDLCTGFWEGGAALQADEIIHESSHNFADFIGDTGREGNAACYARFAEFVGGSDVGGQRLDLCPDPA